MNLCCMMMQKDEGRLLETWLRYYGHLAGNSNVFVWDNGSSSTVTVEILKEAERSGVNVFWDKSTPQDFEKKNVLVGDLIKKFEVEERFDYYLPLDCDEFLGVIKNSGVSCSREDLLEEFKKLSHETGPLRIAGSYYNVPTADRKFFFWRESKVMFRKGTFASTDLGFHHGATLDGSPEVETPFVHLHFQHKPLPTLLAHARNKLNLRVKDFSLETLATYEGAGSHLIKYFRMTEEDYVKSFDINGAVKVPSFEAVMDELDASYPFSGEFPVR